MKVAVICANGKEGKLIVEEAISRIALIFLSVQQKYNRNIVYIAENVRKYAPCRQ